jgi:hypothetical protein
MVQIAGLCKCRSCACSAGGKRMRFERVASDLRADLCIVEAERQLNGVEGAATSIAHGRWTPQWWQYRTGGDRYANR